MNLSQSQAKEAIESPKHANLISSIKTYESALRVFTEELDETELQGEAYWKSLLAKMESRSAKKFKRIKQFIRYPLPIVQLTESVLNDFFKVFEGKNRYFNVSANKDIDLLNRWISKKQPVKWVEETAKKVFKNIPSGVVVIDKDEQGEPYLLLIDSERLIDISVKKNGELDYIMFLHSISEEAGEPVKNIAVYDDTYYRVFRSFGGNVTLENEIAHNLGTTPARMFITTTANEKNALKRRVAFGTSLSKLEDWTIFDIFRNYVDHYVPFPVTEAPIKKCPNPQCKGGKVAEEEIDVSGKRRIKWTTCPVCKGENLSELVSPGTHIGIKLKAEKNLEDGSGKFKMHFPETDKMKYVPEKLQDIELEIRYKTVGVSEVLSKEAVNKLQVKGSFASMETILQRNKKELDNIYGWILTIVGKMFYPTYEINVDVNFGTEWYLVGEEELQDKFAKAKEIGLPTSELALIYNQLIETKYKGNPAKLEREKLLFRLDPLPFISVKEAVELKEKGAIDAKDLNFKINFYNFVQKFEEQNGNIINFGILLSYEKRVQKILETLKIYNDENYRSKQFETSGEGA